MNRITPERYLGGVSFPCYAWQVQMCLLLLLSAGSYPGGIQDKEVSNDDVHVLSREAAAVAWLRFLRFVILLIFLILLV